MMISLFLYFFLFATLQTQDSTATQYHRADLVVGEVLDFGPGSVKFRGVVSDSRCPEDVTCIWPGEAKVLLEVFDSGKSCGEQVYVIGSGGNLDLGKWFPSYEFLLSGAVLRPYPKTGGGIKPSEYTLSLRITERKDND